jgi:hypothetical protein
MSLLVAPGCKIDKLDPVSIITLRVSLSISIEIFGEPCSIRSKVPCPTTAFSVPRDRVSCHCSYPLFVSRIRRYLSAPFSPSLRDSSRGGLGRIERPLGCLLPGEFRVCPSKARWTLSCEMAPAVALKTLHFSFIMGVSVPLIAPGPFGTLLVLFRKSLGWLSLLPLYSFLFLYFEF